MKIIVAPDSFKSSLSSMDAIEAITRGIYKVDPSIEVESIPLADGGEGTVEALVKATSGKIFHISVTGPLKERVSAVYGILGDGKTGVLEIASASGIELYKKGGADPYRATSYGTGELINELIKKGCNRVIIGLGGSATNDGGSGIASALGARFLDSSGRDLQQGGKALLGLDRIDVSGLNPALKHVEILAACDVTNPLCGPDGASAVYGPQKGATSEMIEVLDKALCNYASVIEEGFGVDVSSAPGTGAAGGAGAGLIAFCNASLKHGIDIVCDIVDFEKKIEGADLVITGEGRIDSQTCKGKAIYGLALRTVKKGVPLVALGGNIDIGVMAQLQKIGITAVFNINPIVGDLDEAIGHAGENIEFTVAQIINLIKSFKNE